MARETIASMAVRLGIDLTDFQKNMQEFQKTWGKLGQQLQDVGTKIGTTFTTAGAAVATGLGFAVKKAMDFDAQMSRVGAIAGATGGDLEALRQTALDLGASTSKSATEVAVGMELMAAKGYDAQQVIAAMPGVIAAAEASGEDMALVADTVASALNAFQLEASEASRVADVLAKSANTSAAGVQDLQYAFKYAAPVANSLGISLEELAAATGIMADNGMRGEQAGTTLRAALLRLTDPSKEAKKMLDQLGISVTDASGKFLPFDQILAQLAASTANMTDAQKAQALSTIFGTEAMTGMLSLVEAGPDKFRALTAELKNAEGSSAAAAAQMKDNLAGSMEELSGAVETLQISLGSALAPAVRAVVDGLTGIVNLFNKLSPTTKTFIAFGAALTAGLLTLVGVVGFLVAGLGALAAAQWAVILPIAGWVAAVAGVIAILAALAYAIYSNWDSIKAFSISTWKAISSFFESTWKKIKESFITALKNISFFLSDAWNKITAALKTAWNAIASFFKEWWFTILIGIVTGGLGILIPLLVQNWDKIKNGVKTAWEAIRTTIKDLFTAAVNWLRETVTAIPGWMGKAWEEVKSRSSSAWENIKNAVLSAVKNVKERIETLPGVMKNIWDEIISFLASLPSRMFKAGADIMKGLAQGIGSIPIPVPRIDLSFIPGPLGVSIPKFNLGVDMRQLRDFIPFLDSGTNYVPQDMLAYIHKGEAVVPKEYNPAAGGFGAAPTTIVLELDGRVIAQKTFERMGGTFRLRGAVT